jgi:hypothetical protein
MSGYQAVVELRRLEADLDQLGLMLCHPKHNSWSNDAFGDRASVKPKDAEALPTYHRDAELFTGTLEQIKTWIIGVKWARDYDRILRLSDNEKRAKKENEERARQFKAQQGKFLEELKKDHTIKQKTK